MLARGGMAVVYLVRQPALDREVVLKRLDLEGRDPALAQRFVREARLAATLDHPNVVTLFDFFEHEGVPYIAMEYVAGGSLRELVGRLELPQVCGVVEGVLAGLGHAEHRGIAHRDLKPENVLLTRRGNVKIADFGIARAYNVLTQRLTAPGMAIGTPSYMAPEQATNEPLGPYTDLYALGVIAYELLSGRPPFLAETPVGLLYAHVHKAPPPLAALVDPGHAPVCGWVEWLLAKDPAARPQSAAEAWDALEEVAVAELGPYWRRHAAIRAPEPEPEPAAPLAAATGDAGLPTTEESGERTEREQRTSKLPTPTPLAPPKAVPPARRRTRRRAALAAASVTVLAGAAAAAAFVLPTRDGPGRQPAPAPVPTRTPAATPYDFDADGRQELVMSLLRGAPRGRKAHSGVVLVQDRGKKPPWRLITEAGAGLGGRPRINDDFGSGLASADFDRDGHADLAIGTPGRERVSVLYGAPRGLDRRRTRQFTGGGADLPAGAGRYGYTLVASDLDDDGFGDLVVGAPGDLGGQPSTGALHIVFGGRGGLRADRTRIIPRPAAGMSGFGHRLRSADVDGDGRPDLAEGAAARGEYPGHASFCRSGKDGPLRCRLLPSAGSTSGLAIGDVNGDKRADIIQGDSQHVDPELGPPVGSGVVRVWFGSRSGPRPSPLPITQDSPDIPDTNEPGDEFGSVVAAGDVDSDGFADIIVAAMREDAGAGRVTVIRGARDGYQRVANRDFDQDSPFVPGSAAPDAEFGSTLSVLRLSRDRLPDLALAARGENSADERVMVVQGSRGVFTPDETRTTTLQGVASVADAPPGGRIRLARTAGS
jgi:tRNA A-37 threonylcarbamoyl transferase component Bud32